MANVIKRLLNDGEYRVVMLSVKTFLANFLNLLNIGQSPASLTWVE